MRGFTDSLRLELMDTNVRVSLVCPSQVRTNIVRHARHRTEAEKEKTIEQFDTLMTRHTPADGARIILRGLRKNRELIFVGRDSRIYNFASRFTPRFIIKFVVRRELRKLAETDA